ncbi:hypothetical protein DFH09DRAFT_1300981 [Mycena vulgaris]|nr:hypothetical protein DFH09DRAFT_1300981 [Mycena vulgaris]
MLPYFPDGNFVFGEAACERMRWPVPECLYDRKPKAHESADAFAAECPFAIEAAASTVMKGETFILVVVGHGTKTHDGRFRLCISTAGDRNTEAFITKEQLEERAVKDCQGDVLVICNSCHSGALQSSHWQLLSASGGDEYAEALTASASDYVRGSAFAWCLLAGAAQEQGITIPKPRSQKRPSNCDINNFTELPSSPPTHSFSSPCRPLSPPSNELIYSFVNKMEDMEQFLIRESGNRFHHFGFSPLPWHTIFPLMLTQSLVDCVSLYPDYDTAPRIKEIYGKALTGTSSTTLVAVPDVRRQLDFLAPEYAVLPNGFHLREGQDVARCKRYLVNPASLSESDVQDLVLGLRSQNIQAIAVQLIAKSLEWWPDSALAPYISLENTGQGRQAFEAMQTVIAVGQLYLRLLAHFPSMRSERDRASVWWLVTRWTEAGRPKVSREGWDGAVDAAAEAAVYLVLVP